MIRNAGIVAALVVTATIAGQAKADSSLGTANLKLTGLGNGLSDITLTFKSPTDNSVVKYNAGSAFTGEINWSGTFNSNNVITSVSGTTFCVQGMQDVYVGGTYTYDMHALSTASAPIGGSDAGVLNGDAMNIQGFADKYLSTVLGGQAYTIGGTTYSANQTSAAFQLAVWELEYDGTSKNFSSGYFIASAYDSSGNYYADAAGAISLASTWLSSFSAANSSSSVVLESSCYQDQVYLIANSGTSNTPTPTATPLPAALPMGISALGALFGAKKLRRKVVTA